MPSNCLKKFLTHRIFDISCLLANATRIITSKLLINIQLESSRKDCAILTPSVPPAMQKAPQDPDHGLLSQLINPHGKQSFRALKTSSTRPWLETSGGRSTISESLVLTGFPVAQMVEHGASNAKIMGSIPRESKS